MRSIIASRPLLAIVLLAACAPDQPLSPATTADPPTTAVAPAVTVVEARVLPPLPGHESSEAYGINDRGQVVGRSQAGSQAGFSSRLVLWEADGTVRDISHLLPADAFLLPIDLGISGTGTVAGTFGPAGAQPRAFVANVVGGGGMLLLPTGGLPVSLAHAINERLDVAGEIDEDFRFGTQSSRAVIWPAAPGGPGAPVILAGRGSSARDVNKLGQAVGFIRGPDGGELHAAFFANGQVVDLGTLPGDASSAALGVNDVGQAAGTSSPSSSSSFPRAVLWDQGRIVELPGLPGSTRSFAQDISNAGDVVGWIDQTAGDTLEHAVVWRGGAVTNLGVPPGSGILHARAFAINNTGQIVGFAAGPTSGVRAVRWTISPVDVPPPDAPPSNAAPAIAGLRFEPASGPYAVAAKRCGAFTVCVRFSVTDADGASDAPYRVAVQWADGTTWAPNTITRFGVALLAPHNYTTPGRYEVVVTATDRRGAASTSRLTIDVAP